ncbi:Uncharacterised protein [Citrobacter freundii]|nr:Uncharacterised protein [Citrobacter freundii]SUX70500.1 Uncharacterised protein [Citrobacter freundii]
MDESQGAYESSGTGAKSRSQQRCSLKDDVYIRYKKGCGLVTIPLL